MDNVFISVTKEERHKVLLVLVLVIGDCALSLWRLGK